MEKSNSPAVVRTGVFSYGEEVGEEVFQHPKIKIKASWTCKGRLLNVGILDVHPDIKLTTIAYVWRCGDPLYEIIFEGNHVFSATESLVGEGLSPSVSGETLIDLFKEKINLGFSTTGKTSEESVWALANADKKEEVKSVAIYDEGSNLVYQFVHKDDILVYNK